MGISFRVAKGLRIGVTKRGFNASIGPRAARLYVGPSGARVSSGAGPVTVSKWLPKNSSPRQVASHLETKGWQVQEQSETAVKLHRQAGSLRTFGWLLSISWFSLLVAVSNGNPGSPTSVAFFGFSMLGFLASWGYSISTHRNLQVMQVSELEPGRPMLNLESIPRESKKP